MKYLSLASFEIHLERVKARADAGGHSAPASVLRGIYDASLGNLRQAIREMDILKVHDNTTLEAEHPLLLESRNGTITYVAEPMPVWLHQAIAASK